MSLSTTSEWYRVAVRVDGRPSKTPRPSWETCEVLPCSSWPARTTFGPKGVPDGLMAEADAKDGELAGEPPDQRHADAGVLGPPRARRDQDAADTQLCHLVEDQRVVTPHDWFGTELAEVLDQVVDERVVIIDNEDAGRHDADASWRSLWRSPVNGAERFVARHISSMYAPTHERGPGAGDAQSGRPPPGDGPAYRQWPLYSSGAGGLPSQPLVGACVHADVLWLRHLDDRPQLHQPFARRTVQLVPARRPGAHRLRFRHIDSIQVAVIGAATASLGPDRGRPLRQTVTATSATTRDLDRQRATFRRMASEGFGSWRHLAGRFFGALSPAGPAQSDEEWALSSLLDGERDLWRRMSGPDRRHAVDVARETIRLLGPGEPPREVVAAALLHDVGKVESGLGTFARVGVTLAAMAGGRSRLVSWSSSSVPAHVLPGELGSACTSRTTAWAPSSYRVLAAAS